MSVDQAGVRHGGPDLGLGGVGHRHQRQAHLVRAEAQNRHRVFRAAQPRFEEDRAMQRHQLVCDLQCLGIVTCQRRVLHVRAQARGDVRGHRNTAHTALRVEAMGGRVLSRELAEVRPAGDPGPADARQIAGCILHTHDGGQLGQFAHGSGGHVDHGAAGNVVDHDREIAGLGQRRVMGDHSGLRRLVVIGRHHKTCIRTHGLGVLQEADRLDRVVGPGPGDDRHPACGGFHHGLDHLFMFLMGQGRAFARRAHGHQTAAAFGDVPLDKFLQRVKIHRAVLERRDQCGHRAFEHHTLPFMSGIAGIGGGSRPDGSPSAYCQVSELQARAEALSFKDSYMDEKNHIGIDRSVFLTESPSLNRVKYTPKS